MDRYCLFFIWLSLFVCSCTDAPEPIYYWDFEGTSATTITEQNFQFQSPINSMHSRTEYVKGARGTGLRFDGNSTYIDAKLPQSLDTSFSITVWAAIETYPTDTAGFMALYQSPGLDGNWISVGLSRFGELVLGTQLHGVTQYHESNIQLPKFQWFQLGLVAGQGKLEVWLNGKPSIQVDVPVDGQYNRFFMGRDFKERFVHIFPTMHINGVLDELKVWEVPLDSPEFQKLIKAEKPITNPDLNIPASRFADDFHRPKYHVLPAANWTNETHGLLYYNNQYHLFNQKNGTNVYLGQINWGHYSSPDLLQWTEHRPVLTPEKGYDQLGIWSGHTIINDDGQPVIVYTGGDGNEFGMCLAFPRDSQLLTWEKYRNNPVVKGPPSQYKRKDFRDPYLW